MKENSYSDHNKRNFDCGRFKLLTEVNAKDAKEDNKDIFKRRKRGAGADIVKTNTFSSGTGETPDEIFCSNIIINDR